MADYTLELDFGQSNDSPVGDIQGWEDNHPELAIRSPSINRSQALQFGTGAEQDTFTLAATFKGGRQTDLLGADVIDGSYQTVSLRGVATDAVRIATFYNPNATFDSFGSTAYAKDMPGTYRVLTSGDISLPNTSREFSTNMLIQPGRAMPNGITAATSTVLTSVSHTLIDNDLVAFVGGGNIGLSADGPYKVVNVAGNDFELETWPEGVAVSGMSYTAGATVYKTNNTDSPWQIQRSRTGSLHTYAPVGVSQDGGGRVVVDPPFDTPAPALDETFTTDLRIQQAPASAGDPLVFETTMGGVTTGSSSNSTNVEVRRAPANDYMMLTSWGKPLIENRPVSLSAQGLLPTDPTIAIVSAGAPTTVLGVAAPETFLEVGDAIIANDSGSVFPSELTDGNTYYVLSINSGGADRIEIEAVKGSGTAISFATTNDQFDLTFALQGLTESTNYWPVRQPDAVLPTIPQTLAGSVPNFLVLVVALDFVVGERIRISYDSDSTEPASLPAGDYWVVGVVPSGGAELLQLATTDGGSAMTITWDGTGTIDIERLEAYTTWYVSTDRGGAAVVDSTGAANDTRQEITTANTASVFAGSLSGLRIRCTSGANIGAWKHGAHIEFDPTNDVTLAHFDGEWTTTPSANDEFVIEPTPVGDKERPYEKFCQLLPWAPWEGYARGGVNGGPEVVTITHGSVTNEIYVDGAGGPDRTSIQFFTTGALPNDLIPGKTYYVSQAAQTAWFISETYGGDHMLQTLDAGSGTYYAMCVDNENGHNPFPPGFNYPAQFPIPRRYQAYDGVAQGVFYGEHSSQQGAGITAGLQLAFNLHASTGRRTLYVPCSFGGTSIGHKEVHPVGDGLRFGWCDLNQQISWAPGETNGCFGRLEDTIEGVALALEEENSTISEVVINFNQGEEDSRFEYLAKNYRQNLRVLKAAVRQLIVDKLAPFGVTMKPERIKFIHAKIKELDNWTYHEDINAAIVAEADSDPWSRYIEANDLEVHAERDVFVAGGQAASELDQVHYHGTQMDILGQRAFAAYKAMERVGYSETEVCNMALSYLGEPGRLTSVDTDTSREAELCRQFLPIARDELLEMHAWDFALASKTLTVRTTSPRVDWKYAYDYPDDIASVLGLVRSDIDYNYKTMGSTGQHEYSVELDINGDRVVLTDLQDALMLFVKKVTDPTKWSSTFITALAWRMVFHMAGAILQGEAGAKKAHSALQMSMAAMRTATKHDGDHKRDVNISDHVPRWMAHRSNPGPFRR